MKYLKLSTLVTTKERNRAVFEATKILAHQFEVLSKKLSFQREIDWHSNFSGKAWPKEPYDEFRAKHYDFFNPEVYIGDIKLPWEFNKHLHFQELAKAYLITKDEKYAQEFFSQISSWLKENPYRVGVNWIEGLIASHRAISWIIALSIFESSPLFNQYKDIINESLQRHAEFIEETYEFGEKSSNHLIGELCAQIILSDYLNNSKAKERSRKAVAHLDLELKKQIYPDGVSYEQSVSYQRVILEFLYLILILEKQKRITLPKSIMIISEKMTDFMMQMTQPGGHLQPISDADGARVFLLGNDINDFRPHLALASQLFKRGDYKFVSSSGHDAASWFIADKEYKNVKTIKPKEDSKVFEDGGYFISRTGWTSDNAWLFFDCGNIGMGKNPENIQMGTHGHSDTLTFGLNVKAQPFITDIGSYSYSTEKEFHDYFRSSLGHNTPQINDLDQNILANYPWSLFQRANGENQEWKLAKSYDYFLGEHSGYLRLEKPVAVRREIFHLKEEKAVILKDSLIGEGRHFVGENFHLHPEIAVKKERDSLTLSSKEMDLFVSYPHSELEIDKGWYAPNYGKKIRSNVIKFKKLVDAGEPVYFVFSYSDHPIKIDFVKEFEALTKNLRKKRTLDFSAITFDMPENYFCAISRKYLSNKKFLKKIFDFLGKYYDHFRRGKRLYHKALTYEPTEIKVNNLTELLIGYLIKKRNKSLKILK